MASSERSYQVIARRYRPQTFKDVVGQRAAVQQLHNEIQKGSVGHGYLFCGPRGTGKTSMARIFAKALNCLHGPTTEPCGECSHCQEIAAGNHLDVIEVDAATYTKVDNMRDLLEGLNRSSFSARYKVYIIDEVHMLSNASFNALLKSLEEPPSHVVFILCTTNPEKIPETVVSRCRRCNFDRIAVSDLTGSLTGVLEKEGVKVNQEESAAILSAIALASDGGLRDAQVLLDQIISLTDGEVRLETVRSLLGVVESDLFYRLLRSLVARETREALLIVGELVDHGRDIQRFVKMFLSFLRDAMLLRAGGGDDLLRVIDAKSDEMRELLEDASLPFLLNVIQQFIDLEERLRGAAPPRFLLEFTLIKLTAIDPRLIIDPEGGPRATASGGRGPAGGAGTAAGPSNSGAPRAQAPTAPSPQAAYVDQIDANAVPVLQERAPDMPPRVTAEAIEAIPTTDTDRYVAFVDFVGHSNGSLRGVVANARLRGISGYKLEIELAPGDTSMAPLLDRPEFVSVLRECAQKAWGKPLLPKFFVPAQENTQDPETLKVAVPAERLPVDADDLSEPVDDEELEEYVVAEGPLPDSSQEAARPAKPFSKPYSLNEAKKQFPEFREACELIEQHLGLKPLEINGQRIAGS